MAHPMAEPGLMSEIEEKDIEYRTADSMLPGEPFYPFSFDNFIEAVCENTDLDYDRAEQIFTAAKEYWQVKAESNAESFVQRSRP